MRVDLLSTKWWPGGMGKVATHVLLYAQLLIDGTAHGLQTFFVQIRDDEHRCWLLLCSCCYLAAAE